MALISYESNFARIAEGWNANDNLSVDSELSHWSQQVEIGYNKLVSLNERKNDDYPQFLSPTPSLHTFGKLINKDKLSNAVKLSSSPRQIRSKSKISKIYNQKPNELQTSDDTDSDLKNWEQEYNASGGQFAIRDFDGSDSLSNSIFSTSDSHGATEQRISKVEKNEVEPNEKTNKFNTFKTVKSKATSKDLGAVTLPRNASIFNINKINKVGSKRKNEDDLEIGMSTRSKRRRKVQNNDGNKENEKSVHDQNYRMEDAAMVTGEIKKENIALLESASEFADKVEPHF